MTLNPYGAEVLFDGENPRTFTGKARTAISGGDLVVVSGAATSLSSGADSFATSDIVVDIIHDSDYANGIALQNAASGANVTFATRGAYLVRAAGLISGGHAVVPFSGTVQGVAPASTSVAYSGTQVGRAITAAASGTNSYLLVDFQF